VDIDYPAKRIKARSYSINHAGIILAVKTANVNADTKADD
jgi:hypothetical protein